MRNFAILVLKWGNRIAYLRSLNCVQLLNANAMEKKTAVVENGAGGGDGGGHGKGLKRKKMVSVEEISPEFVCPCCMTFFHGSIYLCRWGHSICNACYWTMKRPRVCPKSKKCKGFPR
jgi:hypothetical protein